MDLAQEAHLFRRGQALRVEGRWQEAIEALEAACELAPRPETLLSLAVLRLQQNLLQPALALARAALAARPDYAQAWDALGLICTAQEAHAEALAAFNQASRYAPEQLAFALHRVEAALRCDAADELEHLLEAECAGDPLAAAPLTGLGLLCIRQGRLDAAIDYLDAAFALDPQAAEPPMLLGIAWSQALQPARAEPLLRLGLERDPTQAAVANVFAVTLARLYRYEESVTLLEGQIQRCGPNVASLSNLVTARAGLGETQAAAEAAQAAMRLAPGAHQPARAWCNLLPYLEDVSGPFLREALETAAATLPKVEPLPLAILRDPDRPLRIGLLSNLLRTHPVGWLTLKGLEALDPAAFSVHCFGRFDPADRIAKRFDRFAASWQPTETMPDAEVARSIRARSIDILIDLGGFGDTGRIEVCAHRPAPLQVKWVGMQFHSTGLPFIDYLLTDCWETPAGYEPFYTEKLLRLPDGYICYLPPPDAPEVGGLPALAEGHITFGCLNNITKLTPGLLLAWAEILRAVPQSRLLLRSPQFSEATPRARITQQFAMQGIAPERLELLGRAPHREFIETYNRIDIALDPFPYSGGLSTCEALYMGVPVLTREGEIFAARHSVSHLSNVGLAEWISVDTRDYVQKAIAFATDLPHLAALRSGLRERTRRSPLCDAPRFGRNLGQALRGIWREYCRM